MSSAGSSLATSNRRSSSSSNDNKTRNLIEMKSNQNKYAQLVEAQSPEPQDELASGMAPVVAAPLVLHESDETKAVGDDANAPTEPEQIVVVVDGNTASEERKVSQCSSQVSSCFASTVSAASEHFNRELQSATSIEMTSQKKPNLRAAKRPTKNNHKLSHHHPKQEATTKLTRTISQSMLELDKSARLDRFEVTWRNLSFDYRTSWLANATGTRRPIQVLNNISGSFRSNQLVAVIGPSGCGKTTLLQFLAGNNSSHKSCLQITGLNEPKVAFIGQDDCLLPGLTARETLIYASRLQNGQPGFDHARHIEPILTGLGLSECADRSVTKLSGGQAKRVTIAQELLYPTNLLILDEVTSGLDASTSYAIVKLLKQLVTDNRYPMSIVMSIHQPSAKLFAVFDRVYVMSEGCCLYEGSCQAATVNSYLSRFGLECPKYHNIADYLIEVASESDAGNSVLKEQMIQFQLKQQLVQSDDVSLTCAKEHASESFIEMHDEEEIQDEQDDDPQQLVAHMLPSNSLYDTVEKARRSRERPFYGQMLVHLSRSLLRIRRSYILTYLQLVTYILLGLQLATFYGPTIGTLSGCPQLPLSLMAFVFSNESSMDSHSMEMRRIQENMNFLLVAIMTATFAALEITVITFPLEAKTVKREWRNGWYRVSSYFMGRTLADLPFQLSFVVVFCVLIYTLTGQIGLLTWRFSSFVLIIVMTALVAQAVGFIFGALFMDNLPAAVFTAPLCIFPALLFSGFFSRVSQIPSFYKPMTFLSHFRYAFDALLVTLYGFNRCECDQTTLTTYHASLSNQSAIVKDMFRSLFGSLDCVSGANPEENSIEDTPLVERDNFAANMLLNHTTSRPTTLMPKLSLAQTIKPLEDALVESVFDQMTNNKSLPDTPEYKGDAMDRLTYKFSNRITSMLNSQSNFGHQVPVKCQDFNSYLMTEFDLHDDDLMFGLLMLLVAVVLSRLLCNFILSFTMAKRA